MTFQWRTWQTEGLAGVRTVPGLQGTSLICVYVPADTRPGRDDCPTYYSLLSQSAVTPLHSQTQHCIHPPPPLYLQYRWEDLQPASSRYQYKVRKMSVSKKLYRKENVLLKLRNPLCNITKLHISILPSFKLSSRNFANCMLWCLCWHAVASWRSGPQYVILCCQSLLRITGTHKEEHGN